MRVYNLFYKMFTRYVVDYVGIQVYLEYSCDM